MSAGENAYRVLVGKAEGKRQLGRPRHRRMDDVMLLKHMLTKHNRRSSEIVWPRTETKASL